MKKALSVVLTVTLLVTMAIVAVPVSAATPKLTLSKNNITLNLNGEIEGLSVVVENATTYQSWLAIYEKEAFEKAENERKTTGEFKKPSQFGWYYLQEGIKKGEDLDKSKVPSKVTIDLSTKGKSFISGNNIPKTGDYVLVLFDNDAVGEYAEGGAKYNKNIGGHYTIATASFHVEDGLFCLTEKGVGLGMGDPNESGVFISSEDSYVDTYFKIDKAFDAVLFVVWCNNGNNGGNDNHDAYPWGLKILTPNEDVVIEKEFVPEEGKRVVCDFGKAIPAGSYICRFYSVSDEVDFTTDGYICFPLDVSLFPDAYSDHLDAIGGGASLLDGDDDEYVIPLGFHVTNDSPGTVTTAVPTNNPETQGPSAPTDIEQTSGPVENTEDPTGESEVPVDESEIPQETDEEGKPVNPTGDNGNGNGSSSNKNKKEKKEKNGDEGLSTGAIIGIVAGAVVVIAGAAVAVILILKKKKNG